jgi:tetratricopeptide (TPR) repeat protein
LFSQRGDRVEALYLAEEAVRLLAPGTAEWAMAQFTLGVVLIRLHNLGSAEEHLKIASETWVVLEYRFEYALCIQNLGRVARISGDWGKAHSLYLEACTVLEELERDHDRSIVILNIGANFVEQKKCDEALRLFYAVVPVFRTYKDMRNLAMTWNNIGMALTEMEEWERALEALVESVRLWSSLISVKDRINTQDNLCIVLLHLQRADEARKILEEALIDLSTTYQDDDYFYLKSVIEQHLAEANERLN